MPASELIQVDTSPLSEMEIREIGFLKRYKKAGLDGLLPSFLRDDDELLTLGLTKLLIAIWELEESPKE